MKQLLIILMFLTFYQFSFSQDGSWFNIGAGMPVFFPRNFSKSGGYLDFGDKPRYFFAELPSVLKLSRSKKLTLTPGVSYIRLSEYNLSGALGGHSSRSLNHEAWSGYAKFVYTPGINDLKFISFYYAIVGGYYFKSETSGSSHSELYFQQPKIVTNTSINSKGHLFFGKYYTGFIIGIKSHNMDRHFFKPHIEFTVYPKFVNVFDSFTSIESQSPSKGMVIVSASVGFGKSKK